MSISVCCYVSIWLWYCPDSFWLWITWMTQHVHICIVKVLHRSDWKTRHKRDNWKWWPMVLGKKIYSTIHTQKCHWKYVREIKPTDLFGCILLLHKTKRKRKRFITKPVFLQHSLYQPFKNICTHICYKSKTHSLTYFQS